MGKTTRAKPCATATEIHHQFHVNALKAMMDETNVPRTIRRNGLEEFVDTLNKHSNAFLKGRQQEKIGNLRTFAITFPSALHAEEFATAFRAAAGKTKRENHKFEYLGKKIDAGTGKATHSFRITCFGCKLI